MHLQKLYLLLLAIKYSLRLHSIFTSHEAYKRERTDYHKLFCRSVVSIMKLVNLIPFVVVLKFCNNFSQEPTKVQHELNIFIDMLKFCSQLEGTCYYIGLNSHTSKEIANMFMKRNSVCGTLVSSNSNTLNDDLAYEISNFFVFVETIEEVPAAAADLIKAPLFKSIAYSFFIVTTQVEDLSFLARILSYIWSKNILNFLLIFVHRGCEAYSFLPFAKEKIFDVKHSKNFCSYQNLNRITNINRYPLRAAFYEYPPGTYKNNEKWTGVDLDTFHLLGKMLNATTEIIPCLNANDTVAKLYSNEADIFLVKVFLVSISCGGCSANTNN